MGSRTNRPGFPWHLFVVFALLAAGIVAVGYLFYRGYEQHHIMLAVIGTLLLGAGAALGVTWRQRIAVFYREKSEATEALRASEIRYRHLFDATLDGILVLDAKTGTVVNVNPFLVELLGFSREHFLEKKIWELGFLKDTVASQTNFAELLRKGYVRYENLPLETSDGRRISVEFIGNTYQSNHHTVIQYNVRDITQRIRDEVAKQKKTEELEQANEELTRFAYTVSHDLKSPLVTIKTFLGYLEADIRGQDAARMDKDMAYIRTAADKMSHRLDELLELSRIGRKANPSVEVSLQTVAKEALDLVAGRIAQRGVKVQMTEEPVLLYGDRQRLVEVFQNLVDNAAKFMGDQPAPLIRIGAEKADGETVFFVQDNGIGIDPRHQSKLFGLFEKLDPDTEGTGIGLALARRVVKVHGGRIWAESAGPGQGATFRFTLAGTRRQST